MLKKLLETIRNETIPLPGHPDPGALQDCWDEVFELLESVERVSQPISSKNSAGEDFSYMLSQQIKKN